MSFKSSVVATLSILLLCSLLLNWHLLQNRTAESAPSTVIRNSPAPKLPPPEKSVKEPPKLPQKPKKFDILGGSFRGDSYILEFSLAPTPDPSKFRLEPQVEFTLQRGNADTSLKLTGKFKPETFYKVHVDASLTTLDGQTLNRPASGGFLTPPPSPALEFATDGLFYPLRSQTAELPLRAVGIEKIRVRVRKAYANRTLGFLKDPSDDNCSSQTVELECNPAKLVSENGYLALPFAKLGIKHRPGLYRLEINAPNTWSKNATLTLTDLGLRLVSSPEETAFFVRRLSDGSPVSKAHGEIYSAKFQKLGETVTDENGSGKIAVSTPSDPEDYPSWLVVRNGEDISYMGLRGYAYALPGGQYPPAPPEKEFNAFLFAERGICRPGETIGLHGILRDGKTGKAAGNVPARLSIQGPSGRILVQQDIVGDADGFYHYDFQTPSNLRTGNCTFQLSAPGSTSGKNHYGEGSFAVGHYVPDQLKLSAGAESKQLASGEKFRVKGRARYYFGTPLAGGTVQCRQFYRTRDFRPEGFDNWSFGTDRDAPDRVENAKTQTAPDGTFDFTLPTIVPAPQDAPTRPLDLYAIISATPAAGGRTVSTTARTVFHGAPYYAGSREEEQKGSQRRFTLAFLAPDGKKLPIPEGLSAKLEISDWNYVLRANPDNQRLERVWQEELIVCKTLPVTSPSLDFDLSAGGHYILSLAEKSGRVVHRREFWHYNSETGERSKNPDIIGEFTLDKVLPKPGETVEAEFRSPFDGEAALAVGDGKIRKLECFPVKAGKNKFRITLPANLTRGYYFGALHLISTAKEGLDFRRTAGMLQFSVDQSAHRLNVKLRPPQTVGPGKKGKTVLELNDMEGKPQSGCVLIWGVDSGILALTGYRTPDIFQYFFGRYENQYGISDNYSLLYPLVKLGNGHVGGDGAGNYLPVTNKLLKQPALIAPRMLSVDHTGRVECELNFPVHNGEITLFAEAVSPDRVGSASAETAVHDKLSIQLTVPAGAAAPGDAFEIPVEIFNHTQTPVAAAWSLRLPDGLKSSEKSGGTITIPKESQCVLKLPVRAEKSLNGKVVFSIHSGETSILAEEAITVRSALPAETRVRMIRLEPGKRFECVAPDDLTPETGRETPMLLEAGSPALAAVSSLEWLNEYPYGCLEQTAATAFPFLAVRKLSDAGLLAPELASDAEGKLRAAIARLDAMHLGGGEFSMWPNDWKTWQEGSIFALHFLVEADRAGIRIPEKERPSYLRGLRAFTVSDELDVSSRIYAGYVLARFSPQNAAEYLKNLQFGDIPSEFDRLLLGNAFLEAGMAARGEELLREVNFQRIDFCPEKPSSGLDSPLRRRAFALRLLIDRNPRDPRIAELAEPLSSCREKGNSLTTQEHAWRAYALASAAAAAPGGDPAKLQISGALKELPANGKIRKWELPVSGAGTIENRSNGTIWIRTVFRGVPRDYQPHANRGTLKAEILNAAGKPVSRASVGELLTLRLTGQFDNAPDNVVIAALLPAGLEIEDSRLQTRAATFSRRTRRNSSSLLIRRMEKCPDRLLVFGDAADSTPFTVNCGLRAVTRGTFVLPPVQMEVMYDPSQSATARADETFRIH